MNLKRFIARLQGREAVLLGQANTKPIFKCSACGEVFHYRDAHPGMTQEELDHLMHPVPGSKCDLVLCELCGARAMMGMKLGGGGGGIDWSSYPPIPKPGQSSEEGK